MDTKDIISVHQVIHDFKAESELELSVNKDDIVFRLALRNV